MSLNFFSGLITCLLIICSISLSDQIFCVHFKVNNFQPLRFGFKIKLEKFSDILNEGLQSRIAKQQNLIKEACGVFRTKQSSSFDEEPLQVSKQILWSNKCHMQTGTQAQRHSYNLRVICIKLLDKAPIPAGSLTVA